MTELQADTYLPQETEVSTTWWSHNGGAHNGGVRKVSHTGDSGFDDPRTSWFPEAYVIFSYKKIYINIYHCTEVCILEKADNQCL